jgi:hypothetical protein
VRYVALRAGDGTLVEAVRTRGGTVRKSRFLKGGAFGIPLVACDGSTGGLSRNGRRLVVYASDSGGAAKTRLLVLDPKTLRIRSRVTLNGVRVRRALARRLGDVPDPAQKPAGRLGLRVRRPRSRRGQGTALPRHDRGPARARREDDGYSDDARRKRRCQLGTTLYAKSSSGAFVHALHTTAREAFCIDLPLDLADEQLGKVRMRAGKNVLVLRLHGKTIAKIDTRTFRVTR